MAADTITFKDILHQIELKQVAPIYVLMGDEPYFIDKICDAIESKLLTEDEKLMNQAIFYGKDAVIDQILTEAKQFPLMASCRLIMLKEAQTLPRLDNLDALSGYLSHPNQTTVLVIACKGKKFDARKEWVKQAKKIGIVYESKKLYDNQVSPFIEKCAKDAGLKIEPEATRLILDFVGGDLCQIEKIMERLSVLLQETKVITPSTVEQTVGISKDFNALELNKALIQRNVLACNRFAKYTREPIQKIIPILYYFFSNLMVYHRLQDKTQAASVLHINPYFVNEYKNAAQKYNQSQIFNIIHLLRVYDGKSKGVGSANTDDKSLLKELIFKILNI